MTPEYRRGELPSGPVSSSGALALTPLTGRWRTRCSVCGKEYENGCGSTECCGALQEIISHEPEPLNNQTDPRP